MEIAGLTVGAVGVPALFTTCVEFLDYITLERNHGKDFETSIAKIAILNCRLNVCGESLSIITNERTSSAPSKQWTQHNESITKSLVGIWKCLSDEDKLEKRYGLKAVTKDLMIANQRPGSLAEVESSFHVTSRRRQRETSFGKRAWWAVHDKKKFDSLINDLVFFIESLESISTQLDVTGRQKLLFKEAVEQVQTSNTIRLLEDALHEMPSHQNIPQSASSSTGHTYVRSVVSERGRMIMGNVDSTSDARHFYEDTKVHGRAIAGDVSGEAMAQFFA